MKCANCEHYFWSNEMVFHSKYGYHCYICQQCSERENMPNIKITAEVNGKQVPLRTISTESFEAIKALEKLKEIPVARLATNRSGAPRLLFRPINNMALNAGRLYALDLRLGVCSNQWIPVMDEIEVNTYYENVQPL